MAKHILIKPKGNPPELSAEEGLQWFQGDVSILSWCDMMHLRADVVKFL
ncbi:hypothetical protein [Rossellomorea aquimaris]|nr:hypothetical protein [Rossellomorea aquimaris]